MAQNDNLLWVLVRSILIILTVALCCGIGIGIIAQSWMAGAIMFIIAIIAQFAINSMFTDIAARKNKEADFLAQQVLKEAAERQLPYDLNCAYCNVLNRVGVSFINENVFNCSSCKQPNKIYIQFTTVRITTPLVQKENVSRPIDMGDGEVGVSQSTVNQPIKVNEP